MSANGYYQPIDTVRKAIDKFEILIDVKNFPPETISVKEINNIIYVDAEFVQRQPGYPVKYFRRQIHRMFPLPPGFDPQNIVSAITPKGILSIECAATNSTGHHYLPIRC